MQLGKISGGRGVVGYGVGGGVGSGVGNGVGERVDGGGGHRPGTRKQRVVQKPSSVRQLESEPPQSAPQQRHQFSVPTTPKFEVQLTLHENEPGGGVGTGGAGVGCGVGRGVGRPVAVGRGVVGGVLPGVVGGPVVRMATTRSHISVA
jgi:hypothetical protein